jgi:hypothetical protein
MFEEVDERFRDNYARRHDPRTARARSISSQRATSWTAGIGPHASASCLQGLGFRNFGWKAGAPKSKKALDALLPKIPKELQRQ